MIRRWLPLVPTLVSLCLLGAAADSLPAQVRLTAHVIPDSSYHRDRRVWVHMPAGYDPHRAAPYPLLIAFDGEEYRDTMPLPRVLDSLAAVGATPGFVAVLVDDSSGAVRLADLANARRMVTFLAEQLLPWVRRGWHVTSDPARVIVTGSSAGGLGAAFVAFERPDLIGNVWSQSGAFWRGEEASNEPPWEWLTAQVSQLPRRNVRFALDVGALEDHPTLGGQGPNFLDASRRFHDALVRKGYEVSYQEVPGGNHAPQWWRTRLPVGIAGLSAAWPRP
jgi:enterochelin esterase-like enzyme